MRHEAVPALDGYRRLLPVVLALPVVLPESLPVLQTQSGSSCTCRTVRGSPPPRMRLLISEPAGEPEVAQLRVTLRGRQGRRRPPVALRSLRCDTVPPVRYGPSGPLWSLCISVSRAAALPRPASCHVSSTCPPCARRVAGPGDPAENKIGTTTSRRVHGADGA